MKPKARYLLIMTAILFAGCMGPPADVVNPDNGEKADPVLVEEFRKAFGEFGKEDARKFGGLYLAYADLILKETAGSKTGDALKWLQEAKELLDLQSYPGFKDAVVWETSSLNQNENLNQNQRQKISKIFKRIGLAASEVGR
jgi:hypothetical protein